LVVLDQGIDTSTAIGRMFFKSSARSPTSLLSRHALMSERTRDGLAAARARGRVCGPRLKLQPMQAELARQMYDQVDDQGHNKFTVAQIAAEFDVSRRQANCKVARSSLHTTEPRRNPGRITTQGRRGGARGFHSVLYRTCVGSGSDWTIGSGRCRTSSSHLN